MIPTPGDNITIGLAFLAAGARSCRPTLTPRVPTGAPVNIIPLSVEKALDIGRFDIDCSHAVGEHVDDVDAFCRVSNESLAPGGVAVHIVDFSGHQWDDDIFRRFPEWLWRAMGSNRGFPNRQPLEAYCGLGIAYPYESEATFVRKADA